MEKNGKEINCKTCNELFYTSASRIGSKKYCSRECAIKDKFGFQERNIICKVCSNSFLISKNIELQKKTCSYECWKINNYSISKKRSAERARSICKVCKEEYIHLKFRSGTGICKICIFKNISINRTGKGNPNYKDGHATKSNLGGRSIYTSKHMRACQAYRRDFLEKNEYLYCENCGTNSNGTSHFEVHHLYFASKYPKHTQLHNFKNLIMCCKQCHVDFHAGNKIRDIFLKIEEKRGLKELFKT